MSRLQIAGIIIFSVCGGAAAAIGEIYTGISGRVSGPVLAAIILAPNLYVIWFKERCQDRRAASLPVLRTAMRGLTALALAGALAFPARADDFGDTYDKSLPAVVFIAAVDQNWQRSTGTGVIIDATNGYILTAYHVVGPDRLIAAHRAAYDKAGKLITDSSAYNDLCQGSQCVVIARDAKRDLAVIQFRHPRTGLKAIRLAGKSARPGQAVFTIGCDGESSMWHFASGNARQIYQSEHALSSGQRVSARIIEVTTPLNPGDSGGPLLNNAGELVGINSSVVPNANEVQKGIDVSEAISFIAEINERAKGK